MTRGISPFLRHEAEAEEQAKKEKMTQILQEAVGSTSSNGLPLFWLNIELLLGCASQLKSGS